VMTVHPESDQVSDWVSPAGVRHAASTLPREPAPRSAQSLHSAPSIPTARFHAPSRPRWTP